MASLAELQAWRDALQKARFSGQRRVKLGDVENEFRSDAEMKAALDDIEFEITRAGGATRVSAVRIRTSKGL